MDHDTDRDPYARGLARQDFYAKKTPVSGRVVVVLRGRVEGRALRLITSPSRAVRTGEVHELLATSESGARPGVEVNNVAYLGFVEILDAGVLVCGDVVSIGEKVLGRIAGFDYTHMPNHMNIVLTSQDQRSGEEHNLELDANVYIEIFKPIK